MLLAGLDVETTGLSPDADVITEVGVVLWDWELKTPVLFYNSFVKTGRIISPELIKLTGITTEMCDAHGKEEEDILLDVDKLLVKADYLCAHNAPFDKSFLSALYARNGKKLKDIPTIDTTVDVPFPENITARKLTHLAAEHGFVNPFAHRAVTDVLTMLQILGKYDLDQIIASATTPNILVKASTTYEQRALPKALGFRWNADKNAWVKSIKVNMFMQEQLKCEKAGFSIREL